MIRWILKAGMPLLLAVSLGGCALWPFGGEEPDAFGDPGAARLVVARGEADYATRPLAQRAEAWKEAACDSQAQASEVLEARVRDRLGAAWEQARREGGNDLPSLRQSDLDSMVSDVIARAEAVERREEVHGTTEVVVGVRLSGRLSQCLAVTAVERVGRECARAPAEDSLRRCDALSPPELLYFLEGA